MSEDQERDQPGMPRDIRWIRSILPHRYPMLLVDRVLEIEPGTRIVAIKNVSANEEVLQGHFPGDPVVPGVLQLEGLAQTAGILVLCEMTAHERASQLPLFTGVEKARFRRPVVPGDQLRYEIEVLRRRGGYSKVRGRATVDGQVACEAEMSSKLVAR